jgi:hypothetical protein
VDDQLELVAAGPAAIFEDRHRLKLANA